MSCLLEAGLFPGEEWAILGLAQVGPRQASEGSYSRL